MTARLDLTPTQAGLLWQALAHPETNLEQIVCVLREDVNPAVLARCWQELVDRHAVLRSRFRWGAADPEQVFEATATLPVTNLVLEPGDERAREREFAEFLRSDRQRGLQLDEAPVCRVTLVTCGSETRCVWTFSHVLFDGRSFVDLLAELFDSYDAGVEQRPWTAPELPDYERYREWLSGRDAGPGVEFWQRELEGFGRASPVLVQRNAAGLDGQHVGPLAKVTRVLSADRTARLTRAASELGVTPNNVVQAAWALTLAAYAGQSDVAFGVVRAGRHGTVEGAERMVGVFMNTLPLRVRLQEHGTVRDLLTDLRQRQIAWREHEHVPLATIQSAAASERGAPLFHSILVFDNRNLDSHLHRVGQPATRSFELHEKTGYPVTLYAYCDDELTLAIAYDRDQIEGEAAEEACAGLVELALELVEQPDRRLDEVEVIASDVRRRLLESWNATEVAYAQEATIPMSFRERVEIAPDRPAVTAGGRTLDYRQFAELVTRIAGRFRQAGVGPGDVVGVCTGRTVEMLAALYAIMELGAAYLPLDPEFPESRLQFMLEDSGARVVVTDALGADRAGRLGVDTVALTDADADGDDAPNEERPATRSSSDDAYLIYTSGSTGKPKGVRVTHRNVQNFFAGMDERLGSDELGTWLAVTSLSFDISVLELLWTTCRGFHVVLYGGLKQDAPVSTGHPGFSLFYFAADAGEDPAAKYRVLLEGAEFGDQNGFEAVWTPERHFHAFGGLYPNPSVVGAAIAARTRRIGIRAGSVVLPLHHPLRVAEEWSVVDNLSDGRVGVSFASGWHPNDFVLAPHQYEDRKAKLFENIEVVRRLWRGEAVEFENPKGESVATSILPRPIQRELPIWVTAAGNPETFRQAGERGAFLLTHLLGQTVAEVAEKVALYREAWRAAGHAGSGRVTLMLHTMVGENRENVKAVVREPMRGYLRSSIDLIKQHASAWSATARPLEESTGNLDELSPADLDALLEFSFERYFETSALFGTVDDCVAMVDNVMAAGIDEIGCLIDFGCAADEILGALPFLNQVRERVQAGFATDAAPPESIGGLIEQHGATHLQCTPSMARMLMADPESREALSRLGCLMVGGEALPESLARELSATVPVVHNMYGPTETTIWSSTARVEGGGPVTIGRPIANTALYVLDDARRVVPRGAVGELYIGGDGVVPGYHDRQELTVERFVPDPFATREGARMYRTGDLVRHRPDGQLEYLGRSDHQVKVSGHRIELGEIEAALENHAGIAAAVVTVVGEDVDATLVANVVERDGGAADDDLLGSLRASLPAYMVPTAVVRHEQFPTTPNGKTDRGAIAAMKPMAAGAPTKSAAGVADAEPRIAGAAARPVASTPVADAFDPAGSIDDIKAIWRELLGFNEIGIDSNFFEIGGHSLLTIRLQAALRERLDVAVSLVDLFRFTTLRALAKHVDGKRGGSGGGGGGVRAAGSATDPTDEVASASSRGSMRAAKRRRAMRRRED